MSKGLTTEEYKKLIIDVAIQISPVLVKIKPDSITAGEHIALYARDIAESIDANLKKGY